jgi:ligand-binding sensor domain-containing protein/serine phosphatase RsbU (regulator of sigma subunit)
MKKLWYLFLIISFFSCQEEKNSSSNTHTIKVLEAKGYVVPKDSMATPKVILMDESKPKKIAAGKPEIVPTNTNIHKAVIPTIVLAGKPRVITPGTDTFHVPKSFNIQHSKLNIITAGVPETVIAKDMANKDQNPENFSSFSKLQGLKHGNIICMLEDKSGNLWFGTAGGGVCKYDGKSFTHFTDKEGLSNNVVWSILEDKSGNLWFGTYGGGVSKYDGKSFTHFTDKEGLSNNVVSSILEDKSGSLWFGTYGGGVSKYDGKSFTHFTEKEGLSNNAVRSILEDKSGNLWFGTSGGGVCKYDGNCVDDIINGTNLYQHNQQDLKKNKKDLVKSFTHFTDKEGLSNNVVLSILEDKFGNLWFGTNGGGVSKYDGKSLTHFTDKEGLANNVVLSILEDKSGNLWFGTESGGVCKYNGKSFTHFTDKEGLSNNDVRSMLEDKSGNLWFGTNGGGVCKYDGKSFTHFTDKEGLSNNVVWSMLEDKSGNLWFGTHGGGVFKYDGNCVDDIINGTNLYQHNQQDLKKNKKDLVKSFTHFTEKEGLSNNNVLSILEDKSGNLWFGTIGSGVCKYDGNCVDDIINGTNLYQHNQQDLKKNKKDLVKSFTHFTDKEGLSNNAVLSMLEDKSGNLWFGTRGGGVCKYDGNCVDDIINKTNLYQHNQQDLKKNKKDLVKSFTHFTDKEGLSNNVVLSILEDKSGNLWFGTAGGGVCKSDGKRFTHFTDKEGLSNNVVLSILEDKSGNLWFGTRFGLSKLTLAKLGALRQAQGDNMQYSVKEDNIIFKNYTYEDGFLGIGCFGNSICEATDGAIWIGTNDRLTVYHPPSDNLSVRAQSITDTTAPNIQLTSIELFNENIAWVNLCQTERSRSQAKDTTLTLGNGVSVSNFNFDGLTKWYSIPQNLSLAYNNNYLTFNFIGITMNQPKNVKYQYILEGIDENWSAITNKTSAPYGNLPHGTYTFKVKAMNSEGYWSAPFEYKFTIRPPFWQTWWFRTLIGLIIISSIWYFIKSREKKLIAEKEKLEKTVEERTVEVQEEKKFVVKQKHLIEEKQKEILDSINYAKRIQYSLLASDKLLNDNLPKHFLFFKPKDVVSGDFYWGSKVVSSSSSASSGQASAENFILVTADSTGHGVPGAIMSMLNISCLNEAINADKLSQPADILNATRKKIIEHLLNDGSADGGKDGMDCSLISFDFKNKKLIYAAANNPVWIIRDKTLIVLEADRMPIGKHDKDSIPFTQHEVDLQLGDMVYTLTDGFPDQFGGPKGKKFMYKQLGNLLLSISHESMEIQKQKLEDVFKNWKGDLEQVDDVCVIGMKI